MHTETLYVWRQVDGSPNMISLPVVPTHIATHPDVWVVLRIAPVWVAMEFVDVEGRMCPPKWLDLEL